MLYMEDSSGIIWGLPKGDKPYLIFMDQGGEKGVQPGDRNLGLQLDINGKNMGQQLWGPGDPYLVWAVCELGTRSGADQGMTLCD